ncbi:MAG: hypothetical protein GF368_03225 [Candidatus Aenigmarchaeota archaeon]|nr:hypothetical protein [Candidatus Aenigmarchaeota archaeon]
MNKRVSLVLFLIVFSFQLVLANEVALVVKDTNNLDYTHEYKVNHILEEMGFGVTLIDGNSESIDYSDFAVIVITGRPSNVYSYEHLDDFVKDIPVNNNPTIVIDSAYPDDFDWIEPGAVSTLFSSSPKYIKVEEEHPILSSYSIGDRILTHIVGGQPVLDLEISRSKLNPVASFDNSHGTSVISVADFGQELYDDKTSKARAVFFGITNSLYWTEEAEDMFENSVLWVLADADDDGLLDHEDNCRQVSNPDQSDSDGDGIGNVCDTCPEEDSTGYDQNTDGCIDDSDGDGVKDNVDNCPIHENPDQIDSNEDGIGDECSILPGESVYLDIDEDGTEESATNKNNITDDGYEFYKDPNGNTNALKLDGDDDGFTDYLVDTDSGGYDKYWDPDDEILTAVQKIDGEYYIDTDSDGKVDKVWDRDANQLYGVTEQDVDGDEMNEKAKDNDNDGSFDEYFDEDGSTQLLSIEDGDEDGKNDFVIGLEKAQIYWDPDEKIVTDILEEDVDNDGEINFVVDVDGDDNYDKIYMINTLYGLPDLEIESYSVSPKTLSPGGNVKVEATIRNTGGYDANNFTVSFRGQEKVLSIAAGESEDVSFIWSNVPAGSHSVSLTVDSEDVILESDEDNNMDSETVKVSSPKSEEEQPVYRPSSSGSSGGKRIAHLTGFPDQVVVQQGEIKTVTGQFETNMTFSLWNITFSLSADGFNQSWTSIEPEVIEVLTLTDDPADITIEFQIPDDAEIYTYPLTLRALSNREGIIRDYETEINLLIEEKESEEPTTTTTTMPQEEEDEDKSPLSGLFTLTGTEILAIAIGLLLAAIIVVLIFFRDRIPKIEFRLRETDQNYSYKKE